MKNYLKLSLTLFLGLIVLGCDEDDGPSFANQPETGWVQFVNTESQVFLDTYNVLNPFNVNVFLAAPLNESDLNVTYTLEGVSGADPNTVFSNASTFVIPANTGGLANVGGYPTISFDIAEVPAIAEPMVFDVVMQSTDRFEVGVGIEGSDRPISHRVTICPSLDIGSGIFTGDYVLTVPTGEGPFGAQFADGITVTLSEGNNGPFSRVFQADYLPGIGAGLPVVNVEFVFDGDEITVLDGISTGLGCGAEILLGGDPDNIAAAPCGDASVELNLLDFIGGSGTCGQEDVPLTILLTKV